MELSQEDKKRIDDLTEQFLHAKSEVEITIRYNNAIDFCQIQDPSHPYNWEYSNAKLDYFYSLLPNNQYGYGYMYDFE